MESTGRQGKTWVDTSQQRQRTHRTLRPPKNQRPSFFLTQDHSTNSTTQPYSEDRFVLYRSPWAGRGLGEADVIVRPDWTGPSWGPPFLGGVSARPASPPTPCVSGPAKKEQLQDFASKNESLVRRVGGEALVQPKREEGTAAPTTGEIKYKGRK